MTKNSVYRRLLQLIFKCSLILNIIIVSNGASVVNSEIQIEKQSNTSNDSNYMKDVNSVTEAIYEKLDKSSDKKELDENILLDNNSNSSFRGEILTKSDIPDNKNNPTDNSSSVIQTVYSNEIKFHDIKEDSAYVQEVKSLNNAGIIKGDPNGSFRPDDVLTRAEFATIVCRSLGVEGEADASNRSTFFSDVDKSYWAYGYINTAVKYGMIKGYEDGTFRPKEPVTNEQAIKMLVAGWGYEQEAIELGGYPNGFMEIAKRYGVIDKVAFNYGNASKRWVVSVFTYNAFKMPLSSSSNLKPIDIKLTDNRVDKPIPENGDKYISDPVSILRKITPKSAKYERLMFEQKVPSYEVLPFIIDGKNINYTGLKKNKKVSLYICGKNKEVYIDEELSNGNGFSLDNVPQGEWQVHFSEREGAIKDSYFFNIKKGEQALFSGSVFRYTHLLVQPKVNNEHKQFETYFKSDGQIQGFNTLPLKVSAEKQYGGKISLKMNYIENLSDKLFMQIAINNPEKPMDIGVSERIYGTFHPITYKTPSWFEVGKAYRLTLEIRSEYGDAISYAGNVEIFNDNEEYNIKFIGDFNNTVVGDTFDFLIE